MIDGATLKVLNDQAARRARHNGIVPVAIPHSVLMRCDSIIDLKSEGYSIPCIGSLRPKGFKPVGEPLFVDISGFGQDDEAALSFTQSAKAMLDLTIEHGTLAWATTEMGEFQGYLQAYKVKG